MTKNVDDMLVLPSKVASISKIETFVQKLSEKYDIGEDQYPNILISLTEAVNNAIIHGNNKDESKQVNIALEKCDTGLTFLVSDQGSGFNPSNIPDPTSPENVDCCGGRGVFLMKELCDKLRYKNNGRTVEMFFSL